MKTVYQSFDPSVNPGLFPSATVKELKTAGDDIALRLCGVIDFEAFRPECAEAAAKYWREQQLANLGLAGNDAQQKLDLKLDEAKNAVAALVPACRSRRGRPTLDVVLMLKVVFLQRLKGLSDAEMAFAVSDRTSVQRFLDLPPGACISRQAIWRYKQIFGQGSVMELIARKHIASLNEAGFFPDSKDDPLLLDSSFVEAPKQRNSREENQKIKEGQSAEQIWPGEENKHKRRQKDVDASWTKKNDKTFYGYKMHVLAESVNKFILYVSTTTAKVHDSQAIGDVLSEEDAGRKLYADSAYCGEPQKELTRSFGVEPVFCVKGRVNHPLTEEEQKENREKSKTRCRIEHIFGYVESTMKGSIVRTIGMTRAHFLSWLTVFCYNVARQETLQRTMPLTT